MKVYMSPEEQQRRKQAIAAARRANKELPYKPEPYSQGPYAQAAHASGGKLIGIPLNRAKFDAELAAHAPGCASPVYPYGLEAGPFKCGARLNGELVFLTVNLQMLLSLLSIFCLNRKMSALSVQL